VAVELKGRDLLALGLKPGPLFREILQALLVERLEGRVRSREEEVAWVKENYPFRPGTD
jgi:tRNA nucleotidyltransferase (CCA-adding enzyme)